MQVKWILSTALMVFAHVADANTTTQTPIKSANVFLPIVDSKHAKHADYVYQRCTDFIMAVKVYSGIVANNPVHGKNPTWREPYLWAQDPVFYQTLPFDSERDKQLEFVQNYMTAFGPIIYPSPVLDLPLYLKDKETCISKYGSKND